MRLRDTGAREGRVQRMPGFVIVYNRRTGASEVTAYDAPTGHRDALRRRLELEEQRTDADVEVVSLVSDSIDTIRRTHSRYFGHEVSRIA